MNAGRIYVIAFSDGTVKVGRTRGGAARIAAHKTDARKFGLTVTDEWLSPLHDEWLQNEDSLKKIAASLGGTAHSAEYFSGVSFAAVAERARQLSFTTPEAVPARDAPKAPNVTASLPRNAKASLSAQEHRVRAENYAQKAAEAIRPGDDSLATQYLGLAQVHATLADALSRHDPDAFLPSAAPAELEVWSERDRIEHERLAEHFWAQRPTRLAAEEDAA